MRATQMMCTCVKSHIHHHEHLYPPTPHTHTPGRTESLKLAMLQGAQGGCRSITTRADLAKQHPSLRATLDHLTQEQRVVVELLVASRAVRVVGSAESLMTVFVSEWRGLREAEVAVVRVQAAPQVCLGGWVGGGRECVWIACMHRCVQILVWLVCVD